MQVAGGSHAAAMSLGDHLLDGRRIEHRPQVEGGRGDRHPVAGHAFLRWDRDAVDLNSGLRARVVVWDRHADEAWVGW
jgi:hypothetical protein